MSVLGKQARVALGEEINTGAPRIGAVRTEGRHTDPNQILAKGLQVRVGEAQLLESRGTNIRDHDIGTRHQAAEHITGPLPLVHVQHQGPLVAVQAHEGRALALPCGPQVTAVIAEEGLDLDHVGAQVAQKRGPIRARQHGGHVEDADAFEGAVAGGGTHR